MIHVARSQSTCISWTSSEYIQDSPGVISNVHTSDAAGAIYMIHITMQADTKVRSQVEFEKRSSLNSSLVSTFQQRVTFKKYQVQQAPSAKHFPSTLALDPMAPDRGSVRCRWLALVALVALALDLGGRCFAVEGRRGTALQQVRPEGHPGHEAWQKQWNNDDTPGLWYYHIIHEIVIVKYVSQSLTVFFYCFFFSSNFIFWYVQVGIYTSFFLVWQI